MAMDVSKMKELTKSILSENTDKLDDQDFIMGEMFSAGIPFGKLKSLYKTVGIEEGFIIDPAVIRENIDAEFDSTEDMTFEEWSTVEDYIQEVVEAVDGATEENVLRRLRAYATANQISLPDKPRSAVTRRPGVGKIASIVLDHVKKYPEITRTALYDAIRPHVKSDKNAYDTVNLYFPVAYGIKNGLNADETLEAIKNIPLLEKPSDDVTPENDEN